MIIDPGCRVYLLQALKKNPACAGWFFIAFCKTQTNRIIIEGIKILIMLVLNKQNQAFYPCFLKRDYSTSKLSSSELSNSISSPETIKTTRSQILVTRSAVRSRLCTTQTSWLAVSMLSGFLIMLSTIFR